MELKLRVKIFALPLLALAVLASHGNGMSLASSVAPATSAGPGPGPTVAPGTLTVGLQSGSSLNESGQANVSNNNTVPSPVSSLNSTTEEEPTTLIPFKTPNETTVANPAEPLDINGTLTDDATSNATLENQTSVAQIELTTTSTTPSNQQNSTSKIEPSPSHLQNTTSPQPDVPLPSDNFTTTTKPILSTTTTAATSTALVTTATPATTTTASTTTLTTTTTTTTTTTQGSTQAAAAKEKTTTTVQSIAVSHKAITQSEQNVGEEMVHEGPTLDPLLAGLVSAFIIAAVIITLLLFLKLRRRDSRPEFRRLQDLPMDDMMEDTPLSMYSY